MLAFREWGHYMKWMKYSLETTTEAVDIISAAFHDIGIDGIEIVDNIPLSEEDTKGMFIDILPELPPDEGVAVISFYLDASQDHTEILVRVRETLEEIRQFMDIGACEIVQSETQDMDWINNWKEFFKPFLVGDMLIKPTWEEIPEGMEYNTLIQIDPGTAFGTGSHETTQLCMTQLQKYIPLLKADTILDIGTGSGILGITALKLGASKVVGTDLDEAAIEAVRQNMASNDISDEEFQAMQGNILDDASMIAWVHHFVEYAKGYDIVLANILAPVIILLAKDIHHFMKKGGVFITSGIIDDKEEAVVEAMRANSNLEILEVNHLGEWVNVTVRRI